MILKAIKAQENKTSKGNNLSELFWTGSNLSELFWIGLAVLK